MNYTSKSKDLHVIPFFSWIIMKNAEAMHMPQLSKQSKIQRKRRENKHKKGIIVLKTVCDYAVPHFQLILFFFWKTIYNSLINIIAKYGSNRNWDITSPITIIQAYKHTWSSKSMRNSSFLTMNKATLLVTYLMCKLAIFDTMNALEIGL